MALAGVTNSDLDLTQAGLVDDLVDATIDSIMLRAGGAPWNEADMRATIRFARQRFESQITGTAPDLQRLLVSANRILVRLAELERGPVDLTASLADARRVLASLVFDGAFTAQGVDRLTHVVRYLAALEYRLDQLPADRQRDLANLAEVQNLERRSASATDPEISWMLLEYRVSLWAQHLGTDGPISAKRIRNRIER